MGLTVASFDGMAEFYIEKMEDLLAVFSDTDYQQVRWIIRARLKVT